MAAATRIFELIDTPIDIDEKPGAKTLPLGTALIEFRQVRFAYDNKTPVIDGITLSVNKGEIVAFVGSSGAGKTTLVNLIPRFFDVTEGALLYDGVDVRDVTVKSLRDRIGVVTQEVFLFADTIKNNIAYGHTEAEDEAIWRAAEAAFATDFITDASDGIETMIGERGVKLSGGQRQRLSIARAIMKNPEILILDEATSALDTESEKMVQSALTNLMEGRTVFVIAHRLSTILHANKIVVLDRGKIVDMGVHAELLERGGLYRRLFEMQFNDHPPRHDSDE